MIHKTLLFSLTPALFATFFIISAPAPVFAAAAAAAVDEAQQAQPPMGRMMQGTVRSDEHLTLLKNAIRPNAHALKRIVQNGAPFSVDTSKEESYEAAFRILVSHASTNNADLKLKIAARTGNAQLLAQWGFYPAGTPIPAHLQYVLGKLDSIWTKRNAVYSPENLKAHQIGKNYLYYAGVWLACLKTDLYDRGFLAPADRNFEAAWGLLEETTQYTRSKTLNLFKASVLLKGRDSFNPYENEEMRDARAQAFYEAYKAITAGDGVHGHGSGAGQNTDGIGCVRTKPQFPKDTTGRDLLSQVDQALANMHAPVEDQDNHDDDQAGGDAPSPHPSNHSDAGFPASDDDSDDSDGGNQPAGAAQAMDQGSDDESGCSSPRSDQSDCSSPALSEVAEEDAAVQSSIPSDTMDMALDSSSGEASEAAVVIEGSDDEDEGPIPPQTAKRRAAAALLADSDDDEDEEGPVAKRPARKQKKNIKRKTKEEAAQEKHAFMEHLGEIYKKPDDCKNFTGVSLAKEFSLANTTSLRWIKEYADTKGFPIRKGPTSGQTAKTRKEIRKKFIEHLKQNYKQAGDYKKFIGAQLAEKFRVSRHTALRWLKKYADENSFLIPESSRGGLTPEIKVERKARVMAYLEENYKQRRDYDRFRPVDLMREFSLSVTTASNYIREYATRNGFLVPEAPNKGLTPKIKAEKKAEVMAYLKENYKQHEDRKKLTGTMLAEKFSIHPGTAGNYIREYAKRKGFLSKK